MSLPAATRMGAVHLTVADLDRSIGYYAQTFGLEADRSDGVATLSAGGEALLVLTELPGARPASGYTGLYHFALLLPERRDLARWLAHVARERIGLTGASDHFVSEAIYLRDPDEHGIEIYWDRPRAGWEGQVAQRMTSLPLDTDSLLGDYDGVPFEGIPSGTVMGHVHLRVREVASSIAFYRDVLGFDLMAHLGPAAAFFSAGGYHHHLGANTWESAGAGPAPDGHATLLAATIVLPDAGARDAAAERAEQAGAPIADRDEGILVRDPSGNRLLLTV